MIHYDQTELERAVLPPGSLMFSDLIESISGDWVLPPDRKRDMISGLRRVANALGRPVSDVPADPGWLQPRLEKVAPAALGLSVKSWQNILSNTRAALADQGIVKRRLRNIEDLSDEWRDLWGRVLSSKDRTLPALRRFIHFLSNLGVRPEQVNISHADAYLEAVRLNEISRSPDTTYRAAVNNWNLAANRIPGWPQIFLKLPHRGKKVALPPSAYPVGFMADLEALLKRLEKPDLLDPDVQQQPLRPATVLQYRRQILRFVALLIKDGMDESRLQSVRALLDPDVAEKGLRLMLAQNEGKKNKSISEMAGLLRNLGRILNIDDEGRDQLGNLAQRLKLPSQRGMTRKNRERLQVVLSPRKKRELYLLPDRIFARKMGSQKPHTMGLLREDALAIAILLFCPVRVKNLAEIHLEHHIQRPDGKTVLLVFQDEETKTGRPIEFELPEDVVCMVDRHLATRSPAMCPHGTSWLFPRRDGAGSVDPSQLAGRISKRLLKEIGIRFNVHLFRHLAMMTLLGDKPGSYEDGRHLLGHSSVSHTINLYSGLEVRSATKAFADLVTAMKAKLK